MSRRGAMRFRLTVSLALTGFLALGSFWLTMVIKRTPAEVAATEQRKEPDYFVHNFNYVKMLPGGQPQYHLTGKKLTHFPADDSSVIELPFLRSLDKSKPPQTTRADRAILKEDNTRIHLHDNVKGDRSATATTEAMQLETQYLLVLPDEDAMQTDKPVAIRRGFSTMHGVGMYANNATGEMRLHKQTKVVVAPRKDD